MDNQSIDPTLPIVAVDFNLTDQHCSAYNDCMNFINSNLSLYVGKGEVIDTCNAWINLNSLTFAQYMEEVKQIEHGGGKTDRAWKHLAKGKKGRSARLYLQAFCKESISPGYRCDQSF